MHGLALLLLSAALASCGVAPVSAPAPVESRLEGEIALYVEALNEHRRAVGCTPLRWDPAVARVAEGHSEAMMSREFYGHVDPEGATFTDRLRWGGVVWTSAAENIARTSHGAEQVLYLWLQSRPHRTNIENCGFTTHGVGLSGEYWTHLFVTPDPRVTRGTGP